MVYKEEPLRATEAILILRPDLSAEKTEEKINSYKRLVESYPSTKGGRKYKALAEHIGTRRLAYGVSSHKKTYETGIFVTILFYTLPGWDENLERTLRADDDVLKFIVAHLSDEDAIAKLEELNKDVESKIPDSSASEQIIDAEDVLFGRADYKTPIATVHSPKPDASKNHYLLIMEEFLKEYTKKVAGSAEVLLDEQEWNRVVDTCIRNDELWSVLDDFISNTIDDIINKEED